jgi:hypothetical protein
MHEMEELKQMLCDELEKITRKGELSAGSLDAVDKLTHSIKSIETIMAMNDYSNEGRSYDGSYDDNYGRSYRGRSYARGNGRRSRDYSGRRYSRDEGMMMLKEELEDLMDHVGSKEQEMIRKWMKQID